MDWIPWYIEPTLEWFFQPPAYGHFVSSPCEEISPPTKLDVELIETIYQLIASEQGCAHCGQPLGRKLHVRKTTGGLPAHWPVSVTTRCWGWRRHAHTAEVTRPSKDLMFGDLTPTSR